MTGRRTILSLVAGLLLGHAGGTAFAADADSLEPFFRTAEYGAAILSPDGAHVAVTVPAEDRTALAVVRIADNKIVGTWDFGKENHAHRVWWVNPDRILYQIVTNVGSADTRPALVGMHSSRINGYGRVAIRGGYEFIVIANVRDSADEMWVQRWDDDEIELLKLNTRSGGAVHVVSAPLERGHFLFGHDGRLRYAAGYTEDDTHMLLRREDDAWVTVMEYPDGPGFRGALGIAGDDHGIYYIVNDDGEPDRLVVFDPDTGEDRLLAGHADFDPTAFLWSSDRTRILAVYYEADHPFYDVIDKEHAEGKLIRGLIAAFPDHVLRFGTDTPDGRLISFSTYNDREPPVHYLFDRDAMTATYLFSTRRWIVSELMAPTYPFWFESRDGLRVHGYLTVPHGAEPEHLPLVVLVHGGPHGVRDTWGFDPEVQALAYHDYAVLQVNFRGSGGYGDRFLAAGYRNWGTTMQDDLSDAVSWAVARGYADPERICIYGISYGGYAALMSAIREPDLYKCAVGYAGIYSLELMMTDGDIPESEGGRDYLAKVLPESEVERRAQSPADQVAKLKVPVMLIHGSADRRVPISHLKALEGGMKAAGIEPVDRIVRSEGHGFQGARRNVEVYARILDFLDAHIGERD